MAGASLRPLVDRLLDGGLTEFLREQREAKRSYDAIALALVEAADVRLTSETIRQWCIDLGIADGGTAA